MAKSFSINAVFKAVDKWSSPMKGMSKQTNMFSRAIRTDFAKAQRSVDKFTKNFKRNLGNNLMRGVTFAGLGATGLGAMFVKEASKIENATASFTPLMGSVKKAEELVARLNKEASTTPFQFEGISGVAKQLLPVMNGSIEDTANTFRMLGDTAGGNIQKLESITRGYTKALLKGKPDMEALNMISEAGVPIFSEMAKSMGIAQAELFNLSKRGKLTNDDLTNAFKQMTAEGGIFYKGMEISSKTLTGKFSTLKDNISLTAGAIGTQLLPTLKPLIDKAIDIAGKMRLWVTENKELINQKLDIYINNIKTAISTAITVFKTLYSIIKPFIPLIATLTAMSITYNTVMIASALALKGVNFILGLIKGAQIIYIAMTQGMTVAQASFNAVANANPIGLIILGVATLVVGIIALIKNWKIVKEVMIKSIKFIGKALMTFLLAPLNIFLEMIQGILTLFSKLPGVGKLATAGLENLQGFQDTINKVTLLDKTEKQAPISSSERGLIESRNTEISKGELVIKDQTGRAELNNNPQSNGFKIQLSPSGGL